MGPVCSSLYLHWTGKPRGVMDGSALPPHQCCCDQAEEVGKGPRLWPYPAPLVTCEMLGSSLWPLQWPGLVARSPSVHPAVQSLPAAVLVSISCLREEQNNVLAVCPGSEQSPFSLEAGELQ